MQSLVHKNYPALRKDLVRRGCRDRPGPETPRIAFSILDILVIDPEPVIPIIRKDSP